jgi:hypothetical protein
MTEKDFSFQFKRYNLAICAINFHQTFYTCFTKVEIPKTMKALYWFCRVFWNCTFPCDLSELGIMIYLLGCCPCDLPELGIMIMIYLLGCCPVIGWGATIHDLVLDFHVSRFKVHMLWILWHPKSRLRGLDYFAHWIILQNNWGTQKSCESSSLPPDSTKNMPSLKLCKPAYFYFHSFWYFYLSSLGQLESANYITFFFI